MTTTSIHGVLRTERCLTGRVLGARLKAKLRTVYGRATLKSRLRRGWKAGGHIGAFLARQRTLDGGLPTSHQAWQERPSPGTPQWLQLGYGAERSTQRQSAEMGLNLPSRYKRRGTYSRHRAACALSQGYRLMPISGRGRQYADHITRALTALIAPRDTPKRTAGGSVWS